MKNKIKKIKLNVKNDIIRYQTLRYINNSYIDKITVIFHIKTFFIINKSYLIIILFNFI